MDGEALSEGVRALLRDAVGTFEQLETLLLLVREQDRSWTADAVGGRLSVDASLAREALDHLHRVNLLVRVDVAEPEFRYRPARPELDEAVADLARAYRDQTIAVVKVLNEQAVQRIRSSALRVFADAFLLGKKRRDG